MDQLRALCGPEDPRYMALARQYIRDPREDDTSVEINAKHYEAEVAGVATAHQHAGMERLYRRTLVIEPTMACAAHCRYCLRSNYPRYTLTEHELVAIARYCGDPQNRETLNEVLITGGDPLLIPHRIAVLLDALSEHAPNVQIARIATRLITQDPERIDDHVLRLFKGRPGLRFEVATQINHAIELSFPEVQAACARLTAAGARIYSQNVLIKEVNDDLATLVELYDVMRRNNIEAHYLFHAIPMKGTRHLRTSVDKGLRLAAALSSSGFISGRAKPLFAAMTDVGKVVFYDGVICDRKHGRLLLQTCYSFQERMTWNPSYTLPQEAQVDPDGRLRVWYLDGDDIA
jgi:lysine 2,3-aminomutase